MSEISVKFLGETYGFPTDIIKIIPILDKNDEYLQKLYPLILDLMDKGDWKDENNIGYFKNPMIRIANQIIADLSEENIYDVTVSDLVDNNPGFIKLQEVCNYTLSKMKDIFNQTLTNYINESDKAYSNAAANITGSGIGIFTSSLSSALIYSAMEASTVKKQAAQAQRQYQSAIARLNKATNDKQDRLEKELLINYYYPGVSEALEQFVNSTISVYISKLHEHGIIDFNSVKNYNLERSNEILNNINVVKDKRKALQQAFAICPYNPDVYIKAMNLGVIDRESIETSKIFHQQNALINEANNRMPTIKTPCILINEINKVRNYVEVLSICINISTAEILKNYTKHYYNYIIQKYKYICRLATNDNVCLELLFELDDYELSAANEDSLKQLASYKVYDVFSDKDYNLLIEECGYPDLLNQISPKDVSFNNLEELNKYYFDQIYKSLLKNLPKEKEIRQEQKKKKELDQKEKYDNEQKIKRKKTIMFIISVCIGLFIIAIIILSATVFVPHHKYNKAISLYNSQQYDAAIDQFKSFNGYKDSDTFIKKASYNKAIELIKNEEYDKAYAILEELGDFNDADQQILQNKYERGISALESKNYAIAYSLLSEIKGYKDSNELICESKYIRATEYLKEEEYEQAYSLFEEITNYSDAQEQIYLSKYNRAKVFISNKEYDLGYSLLEEILDYPDAKELLYSNKYERAEKYLNKKKYDKAKDLYNQISTYSDSSEKASLCNNMIFYNKGLSYQKDKDYISAIKTYDEIKGFENADIQKDNCLKILYSDAKKDQLLRDQRDKFQFLSEYDYRDSKQMVSKIHETVNNLDGTYYKKNDDGSLNKSFMLLVKAYAGTCTLKITSRINLGNGDIDFINDEKNISLMSPIVYKYLAYKSDSSDYVSYYIIDQKKCIITETSNSFEFSDDVYVKE